jgi:two-component system NtrC family sensor kinase
MATIEMTSEEILQERIKELTCLYKTTSALLGVRNTEESLNQVCVIVKDAWRFASEAFVEIQIDRFHIMSSALPESTVYQESPLMVFNECKGSIRVHYDAGKYSEADFLPDEQHLLDTVGSIVANFFEKQLSAQKISELQRSVERADRLTILGEITAGIAHELNTPLGNILGFAELIHERSADKTIRSDSDKVIRAAIYSREIVKKLMFFSCEMPQNMEVIKIKPVIDEVLKLLEPNFKKAGVSFSMHIGNPQLQVQTDRIQLSQVLFNLLSNAIYVSPAQSSISIDIHNDTVDYYIDIADSGPGIPEEIKDRIFEPFFTTKPFGEGTGLGLSVVHGIIRSHGGEITAETNHPEGTVFRIKLPLRH